MCVCVCDREEKQLKHNTANKFNQLINDDQLEGKLGEKEADNV